MAQRQKKKDIQEVQNVTILASVYKLDDQITKAHHELKQLETTRKNLISQAVDRKIEQAGDFKLIQTVRNTRTIDMAAMWLFPEKELVQKIAKVSLTDAKKVFGKDRLTTVTIMTPSPVYKVVRTHMPTEEGE